MTTPVVATPRAPLTRQRVLDAAIDLVDRGGLGALTMRRLGSALGVEAMSLFSTWRARRRFSTGWSTGSSATSIGCGHWQAHGLVPAHEVFQMNEDQLLTSADVALSLDVLERELGDPFVLYARMTARLEAPEYGIHSVAPGLRSTGVPLKVPSSCWLSPSASHSVVGTFSVSANGVKATAKMASLRSTTPWKARVHGRTPLQSG